MAQWLAMGNRIEDEPEEPLVLQGNQSPSDGVTPRELASGVRVVLPPRGQWNPKESLPLRIESEANSPEWLVTLKGSECTVGPVQSAVLKSGTVLEFEIELGEVSWQIGVHLQIDGRAFEIIKLRGPPKSFLTYLWSLSPEGPFDPRFTEGDFSTNYNQSRNWIGRRSRYAWFVQLHSRGTSAGVLRRWLKAFFRHYAKEASFRRHSEEWTGLIECLANYKSWAHPTDFEEAVRDVIDIAARKPGSISGTELSDIFAFLQAHGQTADRFRLAVVLAAKTGSAAALAVVLDLLMELQARDSQLAPREFWESTTGLAPMDALFQLMWLKAASRDERSLAIELCNLFCSHEDGGRRRFARGLLPYLSGLQALDAQEWEAAEREFARAIELLPHHQTLRTKALLNAFVAHARSIVTSGDSQAAVEYLENMHREFYRLKQEIPEVNRVWQSKLRREALWLRLRTHDLLADPEGARACLRELLVLEAEVFEKPSERAQQWAKEVEIFKKLADGELEAAEGILEKLLQRAKALDLSTQRTEMTVSSALSAKYLLRGEVELFQRAMKRARDSNGFHFYDFSPLWRVPLVCDISSIAIAACDRPLSEEEGLAVVGWHRNLNASAQQSLLYTTLDYLLWIATKSPKLSGTAEATRRAHVIEVAKSCVQFCMDIKIVEARHAGQDQGRDNLMTLPNALVQRYDELAAMSASLAQFPQTILTKRIMLLDALLSSALGLAARASWSSETDSPTEATLYDRLRMIQAVKWPEGDVTIPMKDIEDIVSFRNAEVHGRPSLLAEAQLDRLSSLVKSVERQVIDVFPIVATARGAGPIGATLLMLDWAQVPRLVYLSGTQLQSGTEIVLPKRALREATSRDNRVLPPGFQIFIQASPSKS